MASLEEVLDAMVAALAPVKAAVPDLQVTPLMNDNPTPPSIDIYPAPEFQDGSGFGEEMECNWIVRARTTTADHDAAQRGLLHMLDRSSAASVENALIADQTLGGTAQSIGVTGGVAGYGVYPDDAQGNSLIGCEWRVMVIV